MPPVLVPSSLSLPCHRQFSIDITSVSVTPCYYLHRLKVNAFATHRTVRPLSGERLDWQKTSQMDFLNQRLPGDVASSHRGALSVTVRQE